MALPDMILKVKSNVGSCYGCIYDSTSNNVYPCLHYVFQGSTTEYPLAANITFAANAYGIFLMRQAFMQVPEDLLESARMDNAGEFKTLFKIVLPMTKGSVIMAELFSFISTWNSYFWPLVMTNDDKVRPMTLAMQRLQDANQGLQWPVLMAANTLLVLPIFIIFIVLNKQIMSSFGYKGIK